MKRNSAIDYLKFIFSIIIFIYHCGFSFYNGYIVVEGFFMISGYLMFCSMNKNKEQISLPEASAKFVWNKYKSLFLPLFFSAISGLFIYNILIFPTPFNKAIESLPLLIFEIFPLQCAGFPGLWTTGVSWYISAMLLSMAILYPIYKRNPKFSANTICPILAILIYGLLHFSFGHIEVTNQWIFGILNTGMLRAIAGISAGFFLGSLVQRSENSHCSTPKKIVLSVLELIALVSLISLMFNVSYMRSSFDLVFVVIQFVILWIALSNKAWHTPHISNKKTKILSNISLFLFLNHYPWCHYLRINASSTEQAIKLFPKTILCVAVSCIVTWALTILTRFIISVIKNKIKQKDIKNQ